MRGEYSGLVLMAKVHWIYRHTAAPESSRSLRSTEVCFCLPVNMQTVMAVGKKQVQFIVATPTDGGAWCPQNGSSLSLINSHVASMRYRSTIPREDQETKATARRPSRGAKHRHGSSRSLLARPSDTDTPPDTMSPDHMGISLHDLQDIFDSSILDLSAGLEFEEGVESNDAVKEGKDKVCDEDIESARLSTNDLLVLKGSNAPCAVSRKGHTSNSTCIRDFGPMSRTVRPWSKPKVDAYTATFNSTLQHGLCAKAHRLPSEVGSILDPFMSLPIKVSSSERMLIQFCQSNQPPFPNATLADT